MSTKKQPANAYYLDLWTERKLLQLVQALYGRRLQQIGSILLPDGSADYGSET